MANPTGRGRAAPTLLCAIAVAAAAWAGPAAADTPAPAAGEPSAGAAAPASPPADAGPPAADSDAPTYVVKDGVLDWDTFAGYLRYNAECIECHGPDGVGSSFAPSLVDAVRTLSYDDFLDVVTNGRKDVTASSDKVMPARGLDPNVMCFVDDIYAYLKGRSDGAIARGRPEHVPVTAAERTNEDDCLGFGGPPPKHAG